MAGKHQLQIALKSVKGVDWSGKKVLDIGCSNGSLTYEILKITKAKQIVGIDIDKKRIIKAKELANKTKGNRLKFQLLDSSNMRIFPDDSFDVVFSNMAFQQFPDFRVVLKGAYRLLKPKGSAIINFNQEKSDVWLEVERLKAEYLGRSYRPVKEKKISAEKFKESAKKIGFNRVSIKSKYDTYFFDNIDDLIGNPKNFTVGNKHFGFSEERYNQLWQEVMKTFLKRKTGRGYKETWNVVFARLTK